MSDPHGPHRMEHDSMGEVEVPTDALWGAQTARAVQNFPISGYVVTRAWMARYPRTAAAFVAALERGQQIAGTNRAAVEQALIPALKISKTVASVMALGTFPLSVSPVALGRVADLMQNDGLLAKPVNTKVLVKELVTR